MLLVVVAAVAVAVMHGSTATAAPLGTAWTYQGTIYVGGSGYTGVCDLRFELWDAASGGSQVGSTQTMTASLDSGLFAVSLDFGNVYGTALWVGREFRCPSGAAGGYTDAGRHSLGATPLAIYASQAGSASTAITATLATTATYAASAGTAITATTAQTATALSGILPIASGGTGASTLAAARIVSGTGAAGYTARWTSPNVISYGALRDDGSTIALGAAPTSVYLGYFRRDSNSFGGLQLYNATTDTAAMVRYGAYAGGTTAYLDAYSSNYTPSGQTRSSGAAVGADNIGGLSIIASNGSVRIATGGTANANQRLEITTAGNLIVGGSAGITPTGGAPGVSLANSTGVITPAANSAVIYAADIYSSTDSGIVLATERGPRYTFGSLTMTVPADLYIVGTASAQAYIDRTPWYLGAALDALRNITGTASGLDHSSLPAFARRDVRVRQPVYSTQTITTTDPLSPTQVTTTTTQVMTGYTETVEEGRDLGAMITLLTLGVQQLERNSLTIVPVPTTSTSACRVGDVSGSTSYYYVCIARNTWKRIAWAAGSW